jgi:hypothetical protein
MVTNYAAAGEKSAEGAEGTKEAANNDDEKVEASEIKTATNGTIRFLYYLTFLT